MRKALCFVVLALFLAVCLVSSIHAADYPSDAPLPKFQVTKASGQRISSAIFVKFEGIMTNFNEISIYFANQGYPIPEGAGIRLQFADGYAIYIINGTIDHEVDTGSNERFTVGQFGKWNTFVLRSFQITGYYSLFASSVYFCDVYAPSLSDLTEGVWVDLQFRQTSPFDRNILLIIVGAVIFVGIAVVVNKRKRGK